MSRGLGDVYKRQEVQILTAGDENGTELEMWTFGELHAQFYQEMVKEWNEQNPDKTINLILTVLLLFSYYIHCLINSRTSCRPILKWFSTVRCERFNSAEISEIDLSSKRLIA